MENVPQFLTSDEFPSIKKIAEDLISEYHFIAMEKLNKVNVSEEKKTELIQLSESLLKRNK